MASKPGRAISAVDLTAYADYSLREVWAARYNTWLLIKLTQKGGVFSFLFFFSAGGLLGSHKTA